MEKESWEETVPLIFFNVDFSVFVLHCGATMSMLQHNHIGTLDSVTVSVNGVGLPSSAVLLSC